MNTVFDTDDDHDFNRTFVTFKFLNVRDFYNET
jgi:hypothetical protein